MAPPVQKKAYRRMAAKILKYSVIRRIWGSGFLLTVILFFSLSASAQQRSVSLYMPAALQLKVEFWKAIYTKYETNQGVLHDSEDLSIIYDAVQLPRNGDLGGVDLLRGQIRETIFNILRKGGQNLTSEERHILSRFPENVSRARLMRATENIRFQRGQADRFKEGIIRSGLYMPYIEKILAEEGAPDFIKYLPHVESSFQEYAMSKFSAAGLWQLMPTTARDFGLKVEYSIDERLDPWTATRAAARHLIRDVKKLGEWPLALTAYNHGPGGVMRAVKSLGTTDIAEISFNYESPSFGFASRNFYSQFLAAVELASQYKKYYGNLPIKPAVKFEVVKTERAVFLSDFSKSYDFSLEEFKRLNPAFRPPILQNKRPIPSGVTVRIPMGSKRSTLMASLDKRAGRAEPVAKAKLESTIKASTAIKSKQAASKPLVATVTPTVNPLAVRDLADGKGWIEIEFNETVSQVAEWLKTDISALRQWNGMDSTSQIEPGQRLLVKFEKIGVNDFELARADYHHQIQEDFFSQYEVIKTIEHNVQRGENLWSLCHQKFDVPTWLLKQHNPKVKLNDLSPGMKLNIPIVVEKEYMGIVSPASAQMGLATE